MEIGLRCPESPPWSPLFVAPPFQFYASNSACHRVQAASILNPCSSCDTQHLPAVTPKSSTQSILEKVAKQNQMQFGLQKQKISCTHFATELITLFILTDTDLNVSMLVT
jgi:hypothetical protein